MKEQIEKQAIEEMARKIGHCESTLHPVIECHNKATGCYCIENPCHNQRIADKLYKAGYRKQNEGEWEKRIFIVFDSEKVGYRCSECNTTWDTETPYCPFCGANMKGGAE